MDTKPLKPVTKRTRKALKTKQSTDWAFIRTVSATFLMAISTITIVTLYGLLLNTQAKARMYEQQVQLALGLYEDAKKVQNALYLDDTKCMEQLKSSDIIQIKVLR